MAKGKNKNKNKTVDVVEEVANEKKNQGDAQTPEPDVVKQNESLENKGEQTKTEEPNEVQTKQQNTQGEEKANQTPQNPAATQQVPTVGQSQPEGTKIVEPQTKNQQTKTQLTKNQQNKHQEKTVQHPATQEAQNKQKHPQTLTENQVVQSLKETQAQKNAQPQVLGQPQVKIIDTPSEQKKEIVNEQKIKQGNAANQMSEDLRDGLQLIGKIAHQIILDPLAHEKMSHGQPQFSQIPYQHVEVEVSPTLQQPKTNKKPFEGLNLLEVNKHNEINIKNSTDSVEPQILEKQKQNEKINILKSYHSSDQQQTKAKQQIKQKQESPKERPLAQRKASQQRRKSEIPIMPIHQSQNFLELNEQQKKQVDYNKLNSDMLAQREKQWQKIHQKATLPSVKSFQMTHPSPIIETGEPVKPYVQENLRYTNNLPIIEKERQIRKASGEIDQRQLAAAQQRSRYEQERKALLQKQKATKEKLEQSEKLRKNVGEDQPIKKLGIAALITATCLGLCVLGKVDKKVSAGVSIASFIGSYFIQK